MDSDGSGPDGMVNELKILVSADNAGTAVLQGGGRATSWGQCLVYQAVGVSQCALWNMSIVAKVSVV